MSIKRGTMRLYYLFEHGAQKLKVKSMKNACVLLQSRQQTRSNNSSKRYLLVSMGCMEGIELHLYANQRIFNLSTTIVMYLLSVTSGIWLSDLLSFPVSPVMYFNGPFGLVDAALPYLLSNQSSNLIGGLFLGSRSELRSLSIHWSVGSDSNSNPAADKAGSISLVQWKGVGLRTW